MQLPRLQDADVTEEKAENQLMPLRFLPVCRGLARGGVMAPIDEQGIRQGHRPEQPRAVQPCTSPFKLLCKALFLPKQVHYNISFFSNGRARIGAIAPYARFFRAPGRTALNRSRPYCRSAFALTAAIALRFGSRRG